MTRQLMTNIDESYYAFLAETSSQMKITKRIVIEQALEHYKNYLEQKKLDEAYVRMSKDQEYLDEMKENTKLLGTL